ncbi:MAG: hypothetical protein ABSF37_04055 [Sedimentisphaerales bacterium]|jgi:hypothetical protein
MPNNNTKYVYIPIAISLLTLFLTLLSSYLLVSFQLSKQHQLWVKQREIIKSDDIQANKVRLVNDLEKAFMNYAAVGSKCDLYTLKEIELYARGEYLDDTKILFIDSYWGLRPDSKKLDEIEEQSENGLSNLFEAYAQLNSYLGLVPTVFSNNATDKATKVRADLALNFKSHFLDPNQFDELVLKQKKTVAEYIKTENIVQYRNSSYNLNLRNENETLSENMWELLAYLRAEFEN